MATEYIWTFTATEPDPVEHDYFPNWLAWKDVNKMRDHIVEITWDRVTEGFDRGLNDDEVISISKQVNEFFRYDVKPSQENELRITLDNDGDEEEYFIIRVWTMIIQ